MSADPQYDPPTEEPGDVVQLEYGHYRVLWKDGRPWQLGQGAMGATYKAVDINLDAPVALKLIRCQDIGQDQARARFVREAKAAAALRHPHVATVFHLGEQGDEFFYAMEFVEGETLETKIRREGMLAPGVALKIVRQVASALAAAARLGIVHRDIKPSNIMLQTGVNAEDIHAKVIDFGLAKTVETTGEEAGVTRSLLTQGGFLGTPHFASPEQLEEKELDTRSDIYSLGVTLFYMLAGQTPFSGSIAQVMSQHLYRQPPLDRLPGQPKAVLRLVEKLLQKDPAKRPADGGEVVRLIDQTLAEIPPAQLGGTGRKPPPSPTANTDADHTQIMADATWAGDPLASSASSKPAKAPVLLVTLALFLIAAVVGLVLFLVILPNRMDDAQVDSATAGLAEGLVVPPSNSPAEVRPALPPDLVAEPSPTPEKQLDEFSRRLAEVLALEKEDQPGSLLALVRLEKEFPGEREATTRLERRLARLEIEYPEGFPPEELEVWRTALEEAAAAGFVPAQFLLAESIFRTEPAAGLRLFLAAAEKGHVESMVRAGSMLSAARGVPAPDLEQAVQWFSAAAEKNHPLALTLLADCYLRGLGVPEPDPAKAVQLLEAASALDEPRAMDLLGHLYRKGIGMEEPNFERAYELFSRAAALGNLDAQANLGIMVMQGEGTPRNPARAMALWNEGARQGNDTCMFFYAQTREDPELGNDPVAAAVWYARAARLGHPGAIAWCEERGLAWQDPEPENPSRSPSSTTSPRPSEESAPEQDIP